MTANQGPEYLQSLTPEKGTGMISDLAAIDDSELRSLLTDSSKSDAFLKEVNDWAERQFGVMIKEIISNNNSLSGKHATDYTKSYFDKLLQNFIDTLNGQSGSDMVAIVETIKGDQNDLVLILTDYLTGLQDSKVELTTLLGEIKNSITLSELGNQVMSSDAVREYYANTLNPKGEASTDEEIQAEIARLTAQENPVSDPDNVLESDDVLDSDDTPSQIDLQFSNVLSIQGVVLDTSTNQGLLNSLNIILTQAAKQEGSLRRKNIKFNFGASSKVFQAMVDQGRFTGWTRRTVKEFIKDNNIPYTKKAGDFVNDYKQIALIANAFGDKLGVLIKAFNYDVNIIDLANAESAKGQIDAHNVFGWLADKDASGKLDGKNSHHSFAEKALFNVFKSNTDSDIDPEDPENVIFKDGDATADLIEGFIRHVESGRGIQENEVRDQFKALEGEHDGKTIDNFVKIMNMHPEYKVLYLKHISWYTSNVAADLADITSGRGLNTYIYQGSHYRTYSNVEELNKYESAQMNNFEEYVKSLPKEQQELYAKMLPDEQKDAMRVFFEGLKILGPVASTILTASTGMSININAKTVKDFDEQLVKTGRSYKFKFLEDSEGRKGPLADATIEQTSETFHDESGVEQKQRLPNDIKFGYSIPIANVKLSKSLNRGRLASASDEELKSLNSLYLGLTLSGAMYVSKGGAKYLLESGKYTDSKTDRLDTLSPGLRANLKGTVGFQRDFREGVEFMSDQAGARFDAILPTDLNAYKDEESLLAAMNNNINTLGGNSGDNDDTENMTAKQIRQTKRAESRQANWFKKYMKQNPGALEAYAGVIVQTLRATGAFTIVNQHPESQQNLAVAARNLAKGIISWNEFKRLDQLDKTVKRTKFFVGGNVGLNWIFGNKQSPKVYSNEDGNPGDGEDPDWDNGGSTADKRNPNSPTQSVLLADNNAPSSPGKFGIVRTPISFGGEIGASLSSFMVKYAPDTEKLQYMDDELKTGRGLQPLYDFTLSAGVGTMVTQLKKSIKLPGLIIQENLGKVVFSLDETQLSATNKSKVNGDITKLLNLYVDPNEKNIAVVDNQIIVGDVSALSYINRTYFDEEEGYLIIGKAGVENKILKKSAFGAAEDVQPINIDAGTHDGFINDLAEGLDQDPTVVHAYLDKVVQYDSDTHTYQYSSDDGLSWNTLDTSTQGLHINTDSSGNIVVEITELSGKIDVAINHILTPLNTADILETREHKVLYDKIHLFLQQSKFGPLVSMFEESDQTFKNAVNTYRSNRGTDNILTKQQQFSNLLTLLQNKLQSKSPTHIASLENDPLLKSKLSSDIASIITDVQLCIDAGATIQCDFFMRLFDAQFANSLPNAIMNGTITMDDVEGYHKLIDGKTKEAINKMTIQDYLNRRHREKATQKTLIDSSLGYTATDWEVIRSGRSALLTDHVRKAQNWSVMDKDISQSQADGAYMVWNIRMSQYNTTGRGYNVLPVGESRMAQVDNKVMVQTLDGDTTHIKKQLVNNARKNEFAGYKDLLNKHLPDGFGGLSDDKMAELLLKGSTTVNGKNITAQVDTMFGFYGSCFNDALLLKVSKIALEGEDINGTSDLKDQQAMTVSSQGLTAGSNAIIEKKDINAGVGVNVVENLNRSNTTSNTGNEPKNHSAPGDGEGGEYENR